jgi:DNA gyrase subunit A
VAVSEGEQMLTVTEYGYGKRTNYDEFSAHGRGTGGQIAYGTNERTGELVDVVSVNDRSELMIVTSQGQSIKLQAGAIPVQSRSAMGVRVVDIDKPDYVVGLDRTAEAEESDADGGAQDADTLGDADDAPGDDSEE